MMDVGKAAPARPIFSHRRWICGRPALNGGPPPIAGAWYRRTDSGKVLMFILLLALGGTAGNFAPPRGVK